MHEVGFLPEPLVRAMDSPWEERQLLDRPRGAVQVLEVRFPLPNAVVRWLFGFVGVQWLDLLGSLLVRTVFERTRLELLEREVDLLLGRLESLRHDPKHPPFHTPGEGNRSGSEEI